MSNAKKIVLTAGITFFVTIVVFAAPFYFSLIKFAETLAEENRSLKIFIADNKMAAEQDLKQAELPIGPKLVKKTSSVTELALAFENEYASLISWNNWLFTGSGDYGTKDKKAQVWAYNTITGVTKKIFDLALVTEEIKGDRQDNFQYVDDLKVFNDQLFIGLGGYTMKGYIYEMDLDIDLTRPVVFVGESLNPTIEKYGDTYIVSGAEGDGGCAIYLVQVLDVYQMSLTKVYEATYCVDEGTDVYLGTDGKYIYTAGTPRAEEGLSSEILTEVKVISIADPTKVETIISKSKMPKNIHSVKINKNYLVLFGDDQLTFYTNNNSQLTKIGSTLYKSEGEFLLVNPPGREDILCTFNEIINLKDKTIQSISTEKEERAKSLCNIDIDTYMIESGRVGTVSGAIEQLKEDGVLSAEFEYQEE
ncbi:MAG: hypothetical protein UT32_C0015G0022 [Parcubacteria group bacterium GW2011_GWC2_39_14]|nr:MAG: hypothetical protein UT32_C0015G0022 [Parcubacteria group bacterium GW2011_GWC2_39_14]KKR54418.1 MAG: hypothetical protein UT91_C0016G0022 [Parcubacteria group bacterium GW2011_GWA2_40_23]